MSKWTRPPRAERYRVDGEREEDALRTLTGATSATMGDLIALATLGAPIELHGSSGEVMRVRGDGSIQTIARVT